MVMTAQHTPAIKMLIAVSSRSAANAFCDRRPEEVNGKRRKIARLNVTIEEYVSCFTARFINFAVRVKKSGFSYGISNAG
jgi:hypothetical protein